VSLLTGFGTEEAFVDALLQDFKGRRADARDFALRYRVLLIEASDGVPLDVSLAAMPFEERAIRACLGPRRRPAPFTTNLQRRRPRRNEGVCRTRQRLARHRRHRQRQAGSLDEKLVWQEIRPLLVLKGAPENADRLREILKAARRS
jgi:hypothetical protein